MRISVQKHEESNKMSHITNHNQQKKAKNYGEIEDAQALSRGSFEDLERFLKEVAPPHLQSNALAHVRAPQLRCWF